MTESFSATLPKSPIPYWIWVTAILVVGVLLRLLPIGSGLPYSDYVDEGHVLHQTIDAFNNKSLDAYWYGLPTLPAYSTGAVLFLYGPIYRHFHGHRFQRDLPNDRTVPSSKFNYDLITPVELLVIGRAITASLSIATIVLAGMITRRLANDRAGLIAMLLVAICPALVTRASIVIVDTFAAFFVLLVVYFCVRCSHGPLGLQMEATNNPDGPPAVAQLWRGRQASGYSFVFLAGLATGLVFASKYPIAAVSVVLLTTLLSLSLSWIRRFQLMLLAGLGILSGILLGVPMTFLKPSAVWRDVTENIRAYATIYSPQGYFAQAISMSELGLPLLLIGVTGIILLLRRTNTRVIAISWMLFALVLIALYANSSFRPFRSFLSLVPLLCIGAAFAISCLIGWAIEGGSRWLRIGIPIFLIVGCVGSLAFSSIAQVRHRMAHRDTRLQAIDWLRDHTRKNETILGVRELAILPGEWERVPATVTVVSVRDAAEALEKQPFDYVVTSEFDLRHAADPAVWSGYLDRWKTKTSNLSVLADFRGIATPVVPVVWRTNDERVLILKVGGPSTLTEGFDHLPQ